MYVRPVTATPDLARSTEWFERLGFTRVLDEPTVVSDGGAVLEIDESRTTRPGLRIWGADATALESFGPTHAFEGGHMLASPSGVWIYLMDGEPTPFSREADPPAVLGNFIGVNLETPRFDDSLRFWSTLGLEVTMGAAEQGWVSLSSEDGFALSLMAPFACPHTFANPSFTYFNSGKNPAVIADLRRRDVPLYEEVTVFHPEGEVDNVILREPGGWGFFVFND